MFRLEGDSKIIHKPTVGLAIQNINEDYHELFDPKQVPENIGIRIQHLCKNSTLSQVKVGIDDILLQVEHTSIDSYGECNVEWSKGKVPFSSIVKRKEKGSVIHFQVYRNKTKRVSDIYHVLQDTPALFGIREYFPYIETIPYEIIGGIVFMNLSINHLSDERFVFLSYLILQNSLDRPRVIISHIFPDSSNLHHGIVSPGNLVKRINDQDVYTIQDMQKQLLKPIIEPKTKTPYLKIETDSSNIIYLKLSEIVAHDQSLAKKYKFQLSDDWNRVKQIASKST